MTGSSKNVEPNRLVVVRDRVLLEALGAAGPAGRWIARAAAAVVIAQTREHQFGRGSCPAHLPEAEVARLLGIPAELSVRDMLAHAARDGRARRRRRP